MVGEHGVEWRGIGGRRVGGSGEIATVGVGVGVDVVDQQGDAARHHHIIVFAVDGTETKNIKTTRLRRKTKSGRDVILHVRP